MSKRNYPRVTTPRGVFIYPRFVEPDTKFVKPHGEYSTRYALEAGSPEAEELVGKLEAILDAYIEENPDELKPAALKKAARADIYEEELDDEGEETGRILFRFKLKAMVETEKKSWPQKPRLFDAAAQPLDEGVNPWTGSEGKANIEVFPYFMQSTKTFGLSLRLKGVQILKLVQGDGGSADSYGFDAEEGYAPEADDSGFDNEAGSEEGDDTEF